MVLLIDDTARGHWTRTQQTHLGLRALVKGPRLLSDEPF